MKEVYYVNQQPYNVECLKRAIVKALQIQKSDDGVQTIVIIVPAASQFSLLSELFSSADIKNRCYHLEKENIEIRFETVKSYSAPVSSNQILIFLCVSPKGLYQFEDEWCAQYWIIVPWIMSEMESWLKVHSAKDVSNGVTLANDYSLDEKVQNGINWLKATSFPNEGFSHPLDYNRLKCMANAIAEFDLIISYESVLYYCLNHGINHSGGRKIADAFVKAQSHRFKTDGNYPLKFLKEMMNNKH